MASTFIVYTENKSDILARIVLLFHRRAVRIFSLHMEPAERASLLRIEITAEVESERSVRLAGDLYKLVDVLSVANASEQCEQAGATQFANPCKT